MNFFYYDFSENIIANLIKNNDLDKNVLVFPNKSVKKYGIELFQQNWQNIDLLFITFQELEHLIEKTGKFPLKGIKREIALLSCLSEKEKEFFKLSDYKEKKDFVDSFFRFFQELLAENLAIQDILKITLFDWQKEILLKFENIKSKYKIYLQENNFFDDIFWQYEHISEEYFANYQTIHFISHYYYTAREKKIIKFLAEKKEANFHFQIPQNFVDEVNFEIKDFALNDLLKKKYSTQKINIFYFNNDFSMNYFLLKNYSNNDFLLSNNFMGNSNFPLISFGNEYAFPNSSLYLYLNFFEQLIEKSKKINFNLYFPLIYLYDNFKYIEKSYEEDYLLFMSEMEKLLLNDTKFICKKDFSKDDLLYMVLENFENIFNKIQQIKGSEDLIKFLFEEEKNIILSEEEKINSNLKEVFFDCLQEFSSFAIKEKDCWKLFLYYLENKKYKIFAQTKLKINDYKEIQIQKKNSLVLVNVSKENFPPSRKAQFLLGEYQRKQLGLKTYQQVKMREKYYFYLAVLNATKVDFCVVKNENLDREESSFIQEIKFSNLNKMINEKNEEIKSYKSLFSKMLNFDITYKKNLINENFFTIPYENELEKINLSYTDFKNLENPFFFYLNSKNLNNNIYEENFSRKFLGILAHSFFQEIFSKENYLNLKENSPSVFRQILQKNTSKLCFDFHDEYLKKYTYKILQESLHCLIKIIDDFLKIKKNIFLEKFKNLKLSENISIKGKVDFLIESENENLIIDFKTGSSVDKEQLKFYSYLFFLHEYPHKKVSSFFYKIFDLIKIDNTENEMNYLKIIEEKVAEIKRKGFFANLKPDYLPEISRSDLMEKK